MNLLDLPNEIITMIFKYIDDFSIVHVSKRFKPIINRNKNYIALNFLNKKADDFRLYDAFHTYCIFKKYENIIKLEYEKCEECRKYTNIPCKHVGNNRHTEMWSNNEKNHCWGCIWWKCNQMIIHYLYCILLEFEIKKDNGKYSLEFKNVD